MTDHHHSKPATPTNFIQPVILRVEGLVKIYGKRRVVDGVSFEVRKGEIVGLLGPNGAGKTTSFRMACGLINTNGGVVYLGNHDVTNWPMYRRSKEGGMGYLPQEKSVFQKLSVQNNLLGVMEMLGIKRAVRRKRCDELLEKLQLTHLRYNYAGGLSGGERRRLEIARSLVSEPKIILLDEPFAAVDPITVTSIQEIIRQLAQEGISILITDHSVQDTLQITQHSYVIQAGQVLCHGTPQEVLANPEARKVYFGENVSVGHIQSVPLFHSPVPSPATVQNNAVQDDDDDIPLAPVVPSKIPSRPPSPAATVTARHDEAAMPPHERFHQRPLPTNPGAETKTRRLGRRMPTPEQRPERPIVRPHSSAVETPPKISTDDKASGMSGVIKTLGNLIWKK